MSRSRIRLAAGSIAGAVALIALVGVALAAKPKGGYAFTTPSSLHYRGASVSFMTSKSGKKLLKFSADLALKCKAPCGGIGGIKSFTRNSVKLKNGKFKVSGNIYGEALGGKNGRKLGTETVTGKFVSATVVKGQVTTNFNEKNKGKTNQYWGVTKSYTASGFPAAG